MGIQERKERERERRRQQIMVAAKRVFAQKGFSRATMEDIAHEAELSPGTLYLYFKSKDELYVSLSIRLLQFMQLRIDHVDSMADQDPEAKLQAMISAMHDVYDFDPQVIIHMFHLQSNENLMNLSSDLLEQIKDLSRRSLGTMAKIIEEGIRQGKFLDRHPVALADVFWSLFSGVVLWLSSKKLIDQNKDYLKSTLDIAFDVFARGLKIRADDQR